MVTSIMIVGVGGQGSLLASKLLGRAAMDKGYDVKVSEVRADLEAQDYVTYVGDFEVRYFLSGEKATTVLIPGEEKEIRLTVVELALKYLLSNVEEIDRTIGTGEYTGEVVYAPRSRYVVKLVIH